ncbi:MAG: hypothetical protein AB3N33_01315 [Puniceicoccaceae bacterium]
MVLSTATLWGFAEATLFFIVPDVWTSMAGRKSLRRGLQACLFAVAGALVGGTGMYFWGSADPVTTEALVEQVPAISPAMMENARTGLEERGVASLFFGPLRVTPYKVFAIYSTAAGISFPIFIVVSCLSRLLRFAITTIVCHYLLKLLPLLHLRINPLLALAICWLVFYIIFFSVLPN